MLKKARLGLYLKDEEIKRRIKIAATIQGMTTTDYCAQAIEERLARDGMGSIADVDKSHKVFLSNMDKLRQEIGSIGVSTAELVNEGRKR